MNQLIISSETDIRAIVQECMLSALSEFIKAVPVTAQDPADQDENLTIAQLAEYWQCHVQTIMKQKRAGLIPFYQSGRKVFFKKSEIDKITAVPSIRSKRK